MASKPMLGPDKRNAFVTTIRIDTGEGDVFYWFETTGPHPTQADVDRFLATNQDQRHGPFASQEETDADIQQAMVGNAPVERRRGWPFN